MSAEQVDGRSTNDAEWIEGVESAEDIGLDFFRGGRTSTIDMAECDRLRGKQSGVWIDARAGKPHFNK